uniref:Uncharacterized protein n=5 Tax=Magallana gigas TaxID=29159 RepID=A0A8W8KAP3_MAGGI
VVRMRELVFLCLVGSILAAHHHHTTIPTTTLDPNSDEARMLRLEGGIENLARQLMMQQLFVEERIRSDGDSGIKQVRLNHKGTRTFFSDTHSMGSINSIHDHSNYINTIGMGEVIPVLNGIEFRTRHNDYKLRMPHPNSTTYHATVDIPFPEVPPSVKSQPTLEKQIEEMKNYFKAWKFQNPSFRDYRPYFKPVLCYMEGAWTTNTKTLDEPFSSDRHFIDAASWFDLQEKIRFTSYTGGKHNLENFSFLPTTIINMRNGTPEYAQWNYRILCHPIKGDLPLKAFEPVDDLASRLAHKYNLTKFSMTRSARFHLASEYRHAHFLPEKGYGVFQDRVYTHSIMDTIMNQIPGKDNYPAKIFDKSLGLEMLDPFSSSVNPLNTGYYHRRYKYDDKGAMGTKTNNRGFADKNLWVAQTTSNHIAPIHMNDCHKVNRTYTECKEIEARYTYAIPLEIIYMTPLNSWNPYNLPYWDRKHGRYTPTKDHRNGAFNATNAYNGTNYANYYWTPTAFFSGKELNHDAADTVKNSVGVLDSHGNVRRVSASGIRIFLPNIPGVGVLRQRWSVTPVHRDGSSVQKELDAMKEMINHIGAFSNLFQEPPAVSGSAVQQAPDAHFRTSLATKDPPGRHYHELFIEDSDYKLALSGQTVTAETTMESSHTHMVEVAYDSHTHQWVIKKCDDMAHCWDGHSEILTKIQ